MEEAQHPAKRSFACSTCGKEIQIPYDLPPTVAPCPHCGQMEESPPVPQLVSPEPKLATRLEPLVEQALELEQEPAQESSPEPTPEREKRDPKLHWMVPVGFAVALIGLFPMLMYFTFFDKRGQASKTAPSKVNQSQKATSPGVANWRPEASGLLKSFLEEPSVARRATMVLGGTHLLPDMEQFYQEYPLFDNETPAEVFSFVRLSQEDTQRGLHLMAYDRPSQFSLSEFFRPVLPTRVRYGLEQPDFLVEGEAALANFVSEPVRVMAFFKRTKQGLKLDWETFAQTKYRLLREFVENPVPGATKNFRVIIREDIVWDAEEREGVSIFRISDPANSRDYTRVPVKDGSPLGEVLEPVRWRGRGLRRIPAQNATVKLAWTNSEKPVLHLAGFICWEFLGLGGEAGNWRESSEEAAADGE